MRVPALVTVVRALPPVGAFGAMQPQRVRVRIDEKRVNSWFLGVLMFFVRLHFTFYGQTKRVRRRTKRVRRKEFVIWWGRGRRQQIGLIGDRRRRVDVAGGNLVLAEVVQGAGNA